MKKQECCADEEEERRRQGEGGARGRVNKDEGVIDVERKETRNRK